MTKSSVRTKILLIAASFSLPLGVLLYLTVANINLRIDFARKELAGTAYLRPMAGLLENVQLHAIEKPGSECVAAAERVASSLVPVAQAQQKYGTLLEFTEEGLRKRNRSHLSVESLEKQWQAIQAAGCHQAGDSHSKMIADIRAMITHAGDTSNLILDPDLDSYYLMDAVVIALPQAQTRFPVILAEGSQPQPDKTKMAVYAAMSREADVERISGSVSTALNEDVNFLGVSPTLRGAVEPVLKRYEESATEFAKLMEKASKGDPDTKFQEVGKGAMQASFALWAVAAGELDRLLQIRIEDSVNYRFLALLLAGIAIVGAYILSWVFMQSITQPLDGLIRSLGPGATLLSECVGRIASTGKRTSSDDVESQIICEELNAHAEDMRKAVYQLSIHVSGASNVETPVKA